MTEFTTDSMSTKDIENQLKEEEPITESMSTKEIEKQLKERKKKEKEQIKEQERINKIQKNNPSWMWNLEYDRNGNLVKSLDNYCKLFEQCEELGTFRYDEYLDKRTYVDKEGKVVEFNDDLILKFCRWSEQYISPCVENRCERALQIVSKNNTYNSAVDILKSLSWDGIERVSTFFIDYLKADDTPLIRELTTRWIVGGVQRLLHPGCQNENILILYGGQGIGKSQVLRWLGGRFGYDENISPSLRDKDVFLKLQKTFLVCFDELAQVSNREANEYKSFLSIQSDTYRYPYGRTTVSIPRHNIYCGSTNDPHCLKDNTDQKERRMYVIKCNRTSKEWGEDYYHKIIGNDYLWEQIWSEAYHIYQNTPNFSPYLPSKFYPDFIEYQRSFKKHDSDLVENITEYLNRPYYLNDETKMFDSVEDMISQMRNGRDIGFGPHKTLQYLNHIPKSYVSRIITDILHKSRADHNSLRNVLDGWCVKKNKCRINGVPGMYYIRGVWGSYEDDVVDRIEWVYDPKEGERPYSHYDDIELTGGENITRVKVCS